MIKSYTIILLFIFIIPAEIFSQVVIGKMVEDNGTGLSSVYIQLYSDPYMYDTVSNIDGTFSFNMNVVAVDDYNLPTGYAVTNNFPNPFNPKTRIGVTVPVRGKVELEVFNILGQSVTPKMDRIVEAGTNYMDIELDGLSNGFYVARVIIDEKYVTVRKMMLVYGSQHLAASGSGTLGKPEQVFMDTILDSLVATHPVLGTKTFKDLPVLVGDTLDLGDLIMGSLVACPPTITYEGRTYQTVEIGEQCWMKQNLNVGTMVLGIQEQTDNGIIQKYCYVDDSTNCNIYGGLYQWGEAMQYSSSPGAQGICPPGWHIPTIQDFEILSEEIGCDGNSLKAVGQGSGNGAGTNTTGFSALLTGRRYSNGTFGSNGSLGVFWSSSKLNDFYITYLHLYGTGKNVGLPDLSRYYGYTVRCLKNS